MERFFNGINKTTGYVEIKPEVLAIDAFNKIWNSDKSKNKREAIKKLTYVFGMCCKDANINLYADFNDKEERHNMIKSHFWEDIPYEPRTDKNIIEAVKVYMKFNPKNEYDIQAEFTDDEIKGIRAMLKQVGYSEVDRNGRLKLTPKDRAAAITQLDNLVEQSVKNKEKANERRKVQRNIRGGGDIGLYEDPNDVPK